MSSGRQQRRQMIPLSPKHRTIQRNNPELYPDVFSPRPVSITPHRRSNSGRSSSRANTVLGTISSSSSSSLVLREELISTTHDFVIRSLRRRLWKAFQEDDKENALRAYQATFVEFRQWLEEEEDLRRQSRSIDEASGPIGSKTGSRRESNHELGSRSTKRMEQNQQKRKKNERHDITIENPTPLERCRLLEVELERKFGGYNTPILEAHMKPSDSFIADDFLSPYDTYEYPILKELPDPVQYAVEQQASENERLRRRLARRPKGVFRSLIRRGNTEEVDASPTALSGDNDSEEVEELKEINIYRTTPLHEAARLGAGDFVTFLLAQGGDPNLRNGYARTALQNCAGGISIEEKRLMQQLARKKQKRNGVKAKNCINEESNRRTSSSFDIGIVATIIPEEILKLMHLKEVSPSGKNSKVGSGGDSRGLFGRLFRSGQGKERNDESSSINLQRDQFVPVRPDLDRLDELLTERMDATLALLSWVPKETGDGLSINAVDLDGRTALHYAAELGRTDICMAILSNFGSMLTIVDEVGAKTPCELASAQGHMDLAAQLEARALLYIDPYGLDDDLMEKMHSVNGESDPRKRLVPPYKWFETLSTEEVAVELSDRVSQTRGMILREVEQYELSDKTFKEKDDTSSVSGSSSASESSEDSLSAYKKRLELSLNATVKHCDDKQSVPEDFSNDEIKEKFKCLQDSHVEAYLAFHNWIADEAMIAFRQNASLAFSIAGVPLPPTLGPYGKTDERICQICYEDDVSKANWMQLKGCEHGFCKDCLLGYVQDCAKDKIPMYAISCPHHNCTCLFAKSDIIQLLEDNQATLQRLNNASTESFIVGCADFKFCPAPGCDGIVHRLLPSRIARNGLDGSLVDYTGATCVAVTGKKKIGDGCTLTYEGVEDLEYNNCHNSQPPPKAHRFCFQCGDSPHWPITCERLDKWKNKIREEIGEVEQEDNFNDLAQKLWIKTNTRPCPACNVPIEKNDGCNHMICSNPLCLHEFCWICRKDWKLHGTATGGFFRCNIWEEDETGMARQGPSAEPSHGDRDVAVPSTSNPDDEGYGTAIYSAREAWRKKQETNRFIHHYTRYEAHQQSASLESKMQESVCIRLTPVVEAAMDFDGSPLFNFGGQGLSFIHSAFTELLECRSVLCHSYAFSYFRYPTFRTTEQTNHLYGKRREKQNFERLQSELETLTEQMSDIVARSHLRATQVQIAFLTTGAAEKRVEFTNEIFQIYKDEKVQLTRYQQRLKNEGKDRSKSPQCNSHSQTPPRSSIAELMSMHQRSRGEAFDEGSLVRALDSFLEQVSVIEHGIRPLEDPDAMVGEPVSMWECYRCTYVNDGGRLCTMCGTRR